MYIGYAHGQWQVSNASSGLELLGRRLTCNLGKLFTMKDKGEDMKLRWC